MTTSPQKTQGARRRVIQFLLFSFCLTLQADEVSAGTKSPRKAFLLSLLLPGLGEYYAGETGRAKIFLGTEIGIWTSFGAFRVYESLRATDAKLFAVTRARAKADPPFVFSGSIATDAHSTLDYLHDLEFYRSRDDFNRRARWRSGQGASVYPETEEWQWEWENDAARLRYRELRNSERRARQRSFYAVGAAFFNRLISGIDAARLARRPQGAERRVGVRVGMGDRSAIEVCYFFK